MTATAKRIGVGATRTLPMKATRALPRVNTNSGDQNPRARKRHASDVAATPIDGGHDECASGRQEGVAVEPLGGGQPNRARKRQYKTTPAISIDGGHYGHDALHSSSAAVDRLSGSHFTEAPQRQIPNALASPLVDDGQAMNAVDGQSFLAVIDEIIELWRQRQAWHRAEKSLTLQAKAICRRFCDGDKKEADKLFAAATINAVSDDRTTIVAAASIAIGPLVFARDHIEANRKAIEKRLTKIAVKLPVWEWAKDIRGIGALSLAAVVGEAGDLSNYATIARLWKRMGLAVIEGERQRRVSGIDALKHGYAPHRRSVVWNIGDCIIKVGGSDSPYRALYDARKVIEAERVATKAHAHNRASRYMQKRLIRDLWAAWRQAA